MKKQDIEQGKNILIIYSHPRENSLNHSIKESVKKGIKKNTDNIKELELYKEKFNPVLSDINDNNKKPEIDKMKADITWADYIVFITPIWWAGVPAILKGYFDRVFTEDFAFKFNQAGLPEGLLENKKALIFCTSDTPPFLLNVTGGILGIKGIIKGILKYSGIKDSRFKVFGPVIKSSSQKRSKWLSQAESYGEKLSRPKSRLSKIASGLKYYIKAMRIPLYTFVFCSMLLGTSLAVSASGTFNPYLFVLALFTGFSAHIAVSYSNELSDEKIDNDNENRTMFNGGTGLLMKKYVSRKLLNAGWIISAIIALAIPLLMTLYFDYHRLLFYVSLFALILGVEYSLPPLKLSRKGLGEISAFIAYGFPLMLIAFIMQTNYELSEAFIRDHRMYLLSAPVSLCVFAVLSLTQIADTEADARYGKKSISVLLKPKRVLYVAIFSFILCIALFLYFVKTGLLPLEYAVLMSVMPFFVIIKLLSNMDVYKKPAGMDMIQIIGMSITATVVMTVIQSIYFFNNSVF